MKKWYLFTAMFQILVGIAAIIVFIFVAVSGESLGKWIITLIVSIAFVIMGVINIINYVKLKK